MLEITSCPLCGEVYNTLFDEQIFQGMLLRNWFCSRCGLVFLSPRMDDEELEQYYAVNYRLSMLGVEGPTAEKIDFEKRRAEHLSGILKERIRDCSVHLDIGAAAGEVMIAVQSHYACLSFGIEPGNAYRQHASATPGLKVYPTLESFMVDAGSNVRADVITMSHVLEHIPDPVKYLSHLRQAVLSPGGHIWIEVPNLFVHTCFEPAHLYSYYDRSLYLTLQKAGFEIVWHKLHHVPRKDPRPHYLAVIARALTDPIPAWRVEDRVSPMLISLRRSYSRSLVSLALTHPLFVGNGVIRRLVRRLPRTMK